LDVGETRLNTGRPVYTGTRPARSFHSTNYFLRGAFNEDLTMQHQDQHLQIDRTPPTTAEGSPKSAMTKEALTILKEGREATLATLRPDGWPQATVINYVNDEKRVYFDCSIGSQKAYNIERNDRISLAIIVPIGTYGPIWGLSLAGRATLIEAPSDLAHVLEIWKVRYPYMGDRFERDVGKFAFYGMTPTVATKADYAAGFGHRHKVPIAGAV
jgi:general stress protein 26